MLMILVKKMAFLGRDIKCDVRNISFLANYQYYVHEFS